jgi:hypothetical protein
MGPPHFAKLAAEPASIFDLTGSAAAKPVYAADTTLRTAFLCALAGPNAEGPGTCQGPLDRSAR